MKLHLLATVSKQTGAIVVIETLPTDGVFIVDKRIDDLPISPQSSVMTWDGSDQPEDFLIGLEALGIREAWITGCCAHTYEKFAHLVNGNILINYVDYDDLRIGTVFPFHAYGLPTII